MASLYDLVTLLDVMRVQKVSQPPFWSQFFPSQINFETPTIAFDKVYGDDRRLAPFVAPNVQGRPQRMDGYETLSFAPAYVKIKDVVDPYMFIERTAGEALGVGSYSLDQRRQAVIAELLRRAKVKFANRNEWLCARAIIDAEVTISGEDYPATNVDFRRNASLTGTLLTTARWSQVTGDPLSDLKAMRQNVNSLSGARINVHVFGADAWDKFAARVDLKELMNKNYGGTTTNVTLISDGYEGMEYMGRIAGLNGAGAIDAWVNTSKYVDDTGAEQFYLDQNTVVGVSTQVQGVRCFGAIRDKAAAYKPLEIFAKNWDNEDPSVEYLLTQSAPLMVPKQPDATFSLNVGD
jgi:hypothetical protein